MRAGRLRPGVCREAGHLCQCAVCCGACSVIALQRPVSIVNMNGNGLDVLRQEVGSGADPSGADMHIVEIIKRTNADEHSENDVTEMSPPPDCFH